MGTYGGSRIRRRSRKRVRSRSRQSAGSSATQWTRRQRGHLSILRRHLLRLQPCHLSPVHGASCNRMFRIQTPAEIQSPARSGDLRFSLIPTTPPLSKASRRRKEDFAVERWRRRIVLTLRRMNAWARRYAPLPLPSIARSIIVAVFRKECSAADGYPRQSGWRSDQSRTYILTGK